MSPPNGEPADVEGSYLQKIEAQNKLKELRLKAELTDLDAKLDALFEIKVPELKQLTTPEELKELIGAIQQGTAKNRKLERFLTLANTILSKL